MARFVWGFFPREFLVLYIKNKVNKDQGTRDQKGVAYDRETGRVKLSGKESVPDFIFPPESMALEVKFCNRDGKLATIVDEMNADIIAYSAAYKLVWFLVYDMGFVRDESEIIGGMERNENVKCAIIKH